MSDPLDELRKANPVPFDGGFPPEGLADQIMRGDRAPSPARWRLSGPMIAFATAAVVLVVGGGVLLAQRADRPPTVAPAEFSTSSVPVTALPPTTAPPTTLPPSTTVPPSTSPSVTFSPEGTVVMPDLFASSLTLAVEELNGLSVDVEIVLQPVLDDLEGAWVTGTQPAAGTPVAAGDQVILTIAAERPIGGAAPWSAARLPQSAVPAVLVDQWENADNRGWCSALWPVELPEAGADGVVRSADFGGGWAVAWDLPTGRGTAASGEPCAECGRSAFGVAGAGLPGGPEDAQRWPDVVEWDDGSMAGYGNEGFEPDDAQNPPKKLSYLFVDGQGCLYNVWSHLGEGHLLALLQSLRFVEGLQSNGIELLPAGVREVIDGGAAPWDGAPLPVSVVPSVLSSQYGVAPASCPAVAFTDLGAGTEDASIRRATIEIWGVAWDNPDGPGRTGDGDFCVDCGRGAFGIGTMGPFVSAQADPPIRIEWDDGSYAQIGWEILSDNRLPDDKVFYPDPFTGERAVPPRLARLVIDGATGCEYRLWSFLGDDHLRELLDNLRFVDR